MTYVDKDGKPMDFYEVVAALLVEEHDMQADDATALVKAHPLIIVNCIMSGMNHRATAMALLVMQDEAKETP